MALTDTAIRTAIAGAKDRKLADDKGLYLAPVFLEEEDVRGTSSQKTPERKRGARYRQPDPGSGHSWVRGDVSPRI